MAAIRLDGLLTVEQLTAALAYDPETGTFTWRRRADRSVQWNGKWAGKQAGNFIQVRTRRWVTIRIERRHYSAHRIAWRFVHGEWPKTDIDHKNGDGWDNRISNLRVASRAQNNANAGINRRNTSGLKGVDWVKKAKRWRAQISHQNRNVFLGHFATPEEAHAAYCEAATRLRGEFARFK